MLGIGRCIIVALAGLVLGAPALLPSVRAQTASLPATVPSTQPSTTMPSDSHLKRFGSHYKTCAERIAAMAGKPVDIIFIGDSITEGWILTPTPKYGAAGIAVWNKYYASRNALDFGVSADGTEHVLWRLEHMDVKQFHPKVAVILIGTNDYLDTPQQIADGVKAVIAKTQETFPGVRIILVSLTPTSRHTQTIADTDKIISQYDDGNTIFYFDLASKMPPVGNSWKGLYRDKLHLTPSGYEIWASEMDPLLDKVLKMQG